MIGTYCLKRVFNGRCAFASVTLSAEITNPPRKISLSPSISSPFAHAAIVGVEYAYEQLLLEGQMPPSLDVTILSIRESSVDTLTMFVVFAACRAFCDALGVRLQQPIDFDPTTHRMVFPFGYSEL